MLLGELILIHPNCKASCWKKSFYCNIMLNLGWHFSIQAEKVREEWWLNAGSHWDCYLIPQTDRIQKGSSYYHPFSDCIVLFCFVLFPPRVDRSFLPPFLPFLPPSFFLLLFKVSRNWNSIWKMYSLFNLIFSLILPFYYPYSLFPLLSA